MCYNKQINLTVFLVLQKILKNRAIAGVVIGVLITLLVAILVIFGAFQKLHLKFADSLYSYNNPSNEIVIIAIDKASTKEKPEGLGKFSTWSRQQYVELLDILKEEEPKVIAFDILFNNRTQVVPIEYINQFKNSVTEETSEDEILEKYKQFFNDITEARNNIFDNNLAAKFSEFSNVILAFGARENKVILPLPAFSQQTLAGYVSTDLDIDGVLRKAIPYLNYENQNYSDLAIGTVKQYLNKQEIHIALENGLLNVNFFGDPFNYKMISFKDVIQGDFEANTFKDKIVLIGITSFQEAEDRYLTPRSNVLPMPGVEFRANEIQTILDGKFLLNQTRTAQILTVAGVAIALTIALNYLGIFTSIIITIFALLAYLGAAHFAYRKGLILNMVYPFIAIVMTYLGSWVYKYFIADRNKREITSAFGHYVSKELVDQISKNPDIVKLGGEKKAVTVFFSDIRDSTGWSEKIPTEQWVAQMNEYFTVMEFILKSYGGTLDKYEGDAIMGFWNAPISQPDHVMRGYLTAIAMRKALKKLHEKWQKEGRPLIEFRIGINTGEAIVGNFGSANRFDYTVMGDTVNTASRLESSANKTYGTSIIVAGFEGQVSGEALGKVVLRELDTVLLPGKKEPVKLFELVCLAADCNDNVRGMVKTYADGLAAYRRKDFASAVVAFESLKDDPAALIMLARCKKLQAGEGVGELDGNMVFAILNK